jgi:putative hemolysin
MDIALLLFLILLNGVLAMSEIAVVSSRQSRLQKLADDGQPGCLARRWRCITSRRSFCPPFRSASPRSASSVAPSARRGWRRRWRLADARSVAGALRRRYRADAGRHRRDLFLGRVGELVPKRLGLLAPERIASLIARPMNLLSRLARPLVWLLSSSSSLLLRPARCAPVAGLIGQRRRNQDPDGPGCRAGVFHASEQEIVANVLRLDEQRIGEIMTHRKDIYLIDLNDERGGNPRPPRRQSLQAHRVCRDGLDRSSASCAPAIC